MPGSSLDRVRAAVDAAGLTVHGTKAHHFMCVCPVHTERTGSLSVTWTQGQRGGLVLLYCHGCTAEREELVAALGLTMADLFDQPLPEREWRRPQRVSRTPEQRRAGFRRGRIGRLPALLVARNGGDAAAQLVHAWEHAETYLYCDADGEMVQEVLREECTVCEPRHKQFRQRYLNRATGSWVSRKPAGFTPVLYAMPALAQALAAGRAVYLVEGEKDADAAAAIGEVATTNAQGGKAFPPELIEVFRGATVRVVLDRDATGWARGVELSALLAAVDARVQLLVPATFETKSDLSDHLAAGLSIHDLIPVQVDEVAAWSAAAAAMTQREAVHTCRIEVAAQLDAVDQAAARAGAGDGAAAEEHRRLARRWAVESELRFEPLRDLVDTVERLAVQAGTTWAREAVETAQAAIRYAAAAARAAHELVGLPVPGAVHEAPAQHAGLSQPAGVDRGDRGDPTPETPGRAAPRRAGGIAIQGPRFQILDGQIVSIETRKIAAPARGRSGEDETETEEVFKQVLTLDVRIVEKEFVEDLSVVDVDAPVLGGRETRDGLHADVVQEVRQLAAYVVAFTHPVSGEMMRMRVSAEEYGKSSWLESLPGAPEYDSRPSGMARVRDAVKAVSGDIIERVRHRATGWRQLEDGQWVFIHAGGAIGAQGMTPAPVLLSGALGRFDLPDPTQDPQRLREMFVRHSGALLTHMPARISAPLLGHVWRAALGPAGASLVLHGLPGSYKTSVASIAMHHWGELWDRTKPFMTLTGAGDTMNAVMVKAAAAKDTVAWYDDAAPAKNHLATQQILESIGRLLFNGETKSRATRDGLSAVEGAAPRATGLMTSEVLPRPGSGAQRLVIVPIGKGDIELDRLIELDAMPSRQGRATLLSSMLQWMAGDLRVRRAGFLAEGAAYRDRLRADGHADRESTAVGNQWAGWSMMLGFLRDAGAITSGEYVEVAAQVDDALREALLASVDPDSAATTGGRIRELLRHSLETGLAYVDDVRTGQSPPWPLASRLGWKRIQIGTDELGEGKFRCEARGIRLGYVLHDPTHHSEQAALYVSLDALEQVLKQASAGLADGLQIDRIAARDELKADGLLICEGTSNRASVKRRIHCEGVDRRTVAILLEPLLRDSDGGDQEPGPDPEGPAPEGPAPEGPAPDGNGPCGGGPSRGGAAGTATMAAQDLLPVLGHSFGHEALPAQPPPAASANAEYQRGDRDTALPAVADNVRPIEPQAIDSSRQQRLLSALPNAGPTRPASSEETPMGRPWPDADGVAVALQLGPSAPCLSCGQNAGAYWLGMPMHVPCWMHSTAATRQAALAARQQTTAASPAPTPPPTAPATVRPRPATPPAAAARPAVAASAFRAAAAVLDIDGIWLPDGHVPLAEHLHHVGHLAELVDQLQLGTQVTQWRSEPGQIWVTGMALKTIFGIDASAVDTGVGKRVASLRDLTRGSAMVTDAIADRWQLGNDGDCLGAWTRVWRGDKRGVWIALIPGMNDDPLDMPILSDDPDAATLARRLHRFEKALRAPWTLSGSTTGFNLAFDLRYKDRDRLFTAYEPIEPARDATLEAELNWSRTPTAEESAQRHVHAYDRGGSHAAGIASLEVGIGAPTHHPDGCEFNRALPGYWRIEVPEIADWRAPHPLKARGKVTSLPTRPVWVTTPTLTLAREWGYEPAILEAWTWAAHGRVFESWYERIRDARAALDVDDVDSQLARDQLKVTYTRTIGMLGSHEHMAGRAGYAPDRRHHIVAKARSNILRRIAQIGRDTDRWPVAVTADTVLYVSDDPDPVTAWPGKPEQLGRGFGQFKVEASGLLADQLRFLTGDGYRGKAQLDKNGLARPGSE